MTGSLLERVSGVMAYVDRPSAEPGESLRLHVSCDAAETWTADVARLLSSDLAAAGGPPLREEVVAAIPSAERPALVQATHPGSYVRIPSAAALATGRLTVSVYVLATLPGDGRQGLVSHRSADGSAGWTLGLGEDGAAELVVATAGESLAVSTGVPLVRGCWYRLVGVVDGAELRLTQEPAGNRWSNRVALTDARPMTASTTGATLVAPDSDLVLGATRITGDGEAVGAFDGRLARPAIAHEGETLAAWDLSLRDGAVGDVRDDGPHGLHGRCVNHPTRAVTGPAWDGTESSFLHAPDQYDAIHFHRDDMTDCGWTPQLDVELPPDLPSGVYAARVRAGGVTDHVPFVVRPPRGRAAAPLLLVLSTNSYLAYANQAGDLESQRIQLLWRRVSEVDRFRLYRHQHRELGASLYDVHRDGSGICHSSWRRPILTMRPTARLFNAEAWQFSADMQLVDWLDRTGRPFDVVCDRDVHEQGAELLRRYPAVMTGTHPEYVSLPMMDAYADYVDAEGRLLYMGGNGFYWVIAYDPDDPGVIEVRRWGGNEAWTARPGEYHLSFTGELGGLWRNRGRAPQKLVGIGFVAQGLDAAGGYRRHDEIPAEAGWVLDGVDDHRFGFFGTMGGAAGLELDAVDDALGTPPGTIVLASSEGHSDDMIETRENFGMTPVAPGGAHNPRVRADMVLIPHGEGGVFAPGSISWAGSLAFDDYANPVARILGNVVDRCIAGRPLLD